VWTDIRFDLTGIDALSELEPVALYRFRDTRDHRSPGYAAAVGESMRPERSGRRYLVSFLYSRGPVAELVTRAFGTGLQVRGFTVVDRTAEHFVIGQSTPPTRLAISGEIDSFWGSYNLSAESGNVYSWIMVRIHDGATGQEMWKDSFEAIEAGAVKSFDELPSVLGQALFEDSS
jgi:hypothetical protein